MSNVVKGTTLFLAGLGTSLVVGWWLKNREQFAVTAPQTEGSPVVLNNANYVVQSEPMPNNIPLPPSAFIDVDSLPTEPIVIKSEVVETADDLTQIEGIGARTVELLAELGIKTFADLAYADANAIKEKVHRASLPTIQKWILSAKELAGSA
jgi:hypothetical protein